MTSRDFCFWLQGFFEIHKLDAQGSKSLSPDQSLMIERHLSLVFKHEIDPSMGNITQQKLLNEAHAPQESGVGHADELPIGHKQVGGSHHGQQIRC